MTWGFGPGFNQKRKREEGDRMNFDRRKPHLTNASRKARVILWRSLIGTL
jgi:hypothetical protein